MRRKTFIKASLLTTIGMTTLSGFKKFSDSLSQQDEKMPVLFVGHGSPMNAIEDNEFSKGWQEAARKISKPKAILCISAHWETKGTYVTAMEQPKTIHDFGGFPQELFNVQYPAAGNPKLAKETTTLVTKTPVGLDHNWGLDHGCWSVVKRMYPDADTPVLQFSLDYTQPPAFHYELGKELNSLRKKGVLIIGSGNIVHNLRMINFQNPQGYDWAIEFNEKLKKNILSGNHDNIINYTSLGSEAKLAVPTLEHYLPLLYTLGLQEKNENVTLFNDKVLMGSASMTSVRVG